MIRWQWSSASNSAATFWRATSSFSLEEIEEIQLAHCWSHVRWKFVEIEKFFPSEVEEMIALIKELYAIEKLAPTGPPGDAMRLDLRRERSKVAIDRIQRWAVETPSLPNSGLGEAIDYMAGMWTELTRFLGDARIALDNNLAERALRNPLVGRKNHYAGWARRSPAAPPARRIRNGNHLSRGAVSAVPLGASPCARVPAAESISRTILPRARESHDSEEPSGRAMARMYASTDNFVRRRGGPVGVADANRWSPRKTNVIPEWHPRPTEPLQPSRDELGWI
jgi:hypothetical protein